jgi:hypothetical protein
VKVMRGHTSALLALFGLDQMIELARKECAAKLGSLRLGHLLTPRSFGAFTPLTFTGSAFGPGGGLPPWKLPAFAVRDACAQPVATFMLPPSLMPLPMSLSREVVYQ